MGDGSLLGEIKCLSITGAAKTFLGVHIPKLFLALIKRFKQMESQDGHI